MFVPCSIVQCLVYFLVLQLSYGEERAGCFTFFFLTGVL